MPKRLRIRHLRYVSLVVSMLFLLGSLGSTEAFTFSVLNAESQLAVGSPEVILQNGTLGSSTIYTNSTSAMVSVEAPLFDFVDNNIHNVDSSADKGGHSNFSAQQVGPDSTIDTLEEENSEAIEDYVDNNVSDVDGSGDKGTLSDFDNMKAKDGMANLTEVAGETPTDLQVSTTCMDQMWNQGQDWEWYSAWTPPGSGSVTVTKLWFWDGDGTVGTGETIYMAMYEDGGGYSKLSGSDTTLTGTGSQGWLSADVSTSYEITLGTAYWIGATCASGDTYNICRDDGANCGNYPPNGVGTYYQTNNYVLDSSVPTGASQSSNKYIIPGITYSIGTGDFELDQEVQFTNVIDFLPTEKLCIYAGPLGDEDLRVDYWNGTGWDNLATDLIAYSCNAYTVSLTSVNFTIRFKGGTESSDTIQDQWQIAASLLRVEGAGSKEDAVDNDASNVDYSDDLGDLVNFDNMKATDSIYANLTESSPEGITYIDEAEASATTGTSAQVNKPTGTAEDDFMMALLVSTIGSDTDGSTMFSAPSGWTNEHDYIQTATSGQHVYVYWKVAGASEPSSYTWTWTDSCGWVAQITTFRNVNTISPIHVEGTVNQESSSSPMSPSVTTTVDDAMIWLYDMCDSDAVPAGGGAPGGSTWIDQTEVGTPGNGVGISTAYFVQASAGATGNQDWTLDVIDENSGQQYALQPADVDCQLDQEVQWADIPYLMPNENLSIYGGPMGDEDIEVDVWNGTGWETVFTDLSSGWNNASITDWLTTSNLTIRFRGGNETGDSSQDTWQIDVALIHVWYDDGETYQLDLEVQWTSAVYTRTSEELCIRTGTFSGSEDIQVNVWNNTGSSWHWIMNLTANQWNNISITSYLKSGTFTVQFLGGSEISDTSQDNWNIDATLIHVWNSESADFVDNNTSDIGSPTDRGTHSNFTAQQVGPDSIHDTLLEEDTSVGNPDLTVTATNTVVNNYTYITENASSSTTEITVNDVSEFSAGDIILIIQMQNGTGVGTAGVFEFSEIASVASNNLTLESGLQNDYYTGTFDDETNSSITQVIKVPICNNVTIQSGASITCPAWNGYTGGIVVFNASGTITVTGDIDADAKGFRGGAGVTEPGAPEFAWAGESWNGKGGNRISEDPNFGGGGGGDDDHVGPDNCGASGGGGGYGTAGSDGLDSYEGQPAGHGGLVYGITDIGTRIFLGSGGGGGGADDSGIDGGDGGAGGGLIIITATTSIVVTGSISADGEDGETASNWAGAGGAGSGGAIWLRADNLTLGTNLVTAVGGTGGSQAQGRDGGDGGDGRVRLDYNSISGSTDPTAGYTGSSITVPSGATVLYELDLEIQWTTDYTAYDELCIKTGMFSGSEDIIVSAWNVSASNWQALYNLTASSWNNVTLTDWFFNENFTIKFLGGAETSDSSQDSWNIDVSLLYTWTSNGTYDYVLRVNNTETESWQIRLKSYSDSNLNRLEDCTISFYNSTDGASNQIVVENGSYSQNVGPWFTLSDSETIYIAMVTEASSLGTSIIHVYLEILTLGTTTYTQYILEFIIS